MTLPAWLEALKEAEAKATKGWFWDKLTGDLGIKYKIDDGYGSGVFWCPAGSEDATCREEDGELIAALRNAAPRLLRIAEAASVLDRALNDDTFTNELDCCQKRYEAGRVLRAALRGEEES